MATVLLFPPHEDNNMFILQNQYHGCWIPGDDGARASIAIVSNYWILGLSSRRLKHPGMKNAEKIEHAKGYFIFKISFMSYFQKKGQIFWASFLQILNWCISNM